jgi:hypothetical protein
VTKMLVRDENRARWMMDEEWDAKSIVADPEASF